MTDCKELVEGIKRAALDAVASANPAGVMFGTVVSASPLSVSVDPKMTLKAAQLVLTRNVTNFTTTVTINDQTAPESAHTHELPGGETTTGAKAHQHAVTGTKTVSINNGLVAGEKVVLLKIQGGQQYVVIDRIGGAA